LTIFKGGVFDICLTLTNIFSFIEKSR